MSFVLRDYQATLIERARQALREKCKSMVLVLPTGGGKTCISGTIIGNAASRGNTCWFINHRRELIKQSSKTFRMVGIDHGIVSAGFQPLPRAPVQICGIQSLANRLELLPPPDLIVWDECHHVAAGTWAKIFSLYPDAIHIGVTATPCRLDGAGLGDWFSRMIEGPTMQWLIENGFLSKYRLFGAAELALSGLKRSGGDFAHGQLEALVDKAAIIGDAVEHYQKHCPGARNIVFAASIRHSQHIVDQFNAAGYPAAHLDGSMDPGYRDRILAAFERGDLRVLSNVDLFGEGFDVPAIEAVTLMRPTMSTGLYLQQVGRALRPAPGKTHAVILDHVGNWKRHGLPDEIREWNLDPKVKLKRAANDNDDVLDIKTCPQCYAVHRPQPTCPNCGHEYVSQRRQLEQKDGELVEIDVEAARREKLKQQAAAKTLEELIELGRQRNYKNPRGWAKHMLAAREKKADNRMMRYG